MPGMLYLALISLVAIGLGSLAAPASASEVRVGLTPCWLEGVANQALCGRLSRPLDPAHPAGTVIDVHYAVLPALARNRLPDPVFFIAGGPGQSAIELAEVVGGRMARLNNRRDLVLVDQRGTGQSAPLRCEPLAPTSALAAGADPARQAARLQRCREQLQRLPYGDLRFFTTAIASTDLDAVRQALQADRIDLVGGSYGTRVVLDYLRQFPQRVRRAVMDGVVPPDIALPAAASPDNQAALDAVWSACEAEPACHRRHSDLRGDWRRLLAALPVQVRVAHPLTGQPETLWMTRTVLLSLVRTPLYAPALAAGLPEAIAAAAKGHFEPLFGLASALSNRRLGEVAEGMHLSVVCSEDVPSDGVRTAVRGVDFGDDFAATYRTLCKDWPRATVPAAFRLIAKAPAATLVLSGGADPVTPPRHGARIAQALGPLARHVVVAQAGHGVLALPCLRDALYRFIDAATDAEALKVDTSCAESIPRPPAFVPVTALDASIPQ